MIKINIMQHFALNFEYFRLFYLPYLIIYFYVYLEMWFFSEYQIEYFLDILEANVSIITK